ncbi:unnamed protein product [Oikopleura dioica]|uniref:Uncharacterized protein n=1 Tax=Oikopleura dioica TaxID=34765 RepID=E4Y7N8_OIKDI|nr:unnamed protein product [Oikopleura dioica]
MSIFLTSIFAFVFGLGWLHLATRDVHTILWRVTLVTAAVLIHLQALGDIKSSFLGGELSCIENFRQRALISIVLVVNGS